MKFKKLTAAVMAAAMLAAAAPLAGVLNSALSITASAASPAPVQTEYKAGDMIAVDLDENGIFTATDTAAKTSQEISDLCPEFVCTVKSDGTLKLEKYAWAPTIRKVFYLENKTATIPSEILGYPVSEIGYMYSGNLVLGAKKIIIPNTITTISVGAFAYSLNLEEVEFAEGSQLKLIDQWAFQDCRSLKSITIPACVETIAYGAFMNSAPTDMEKLQTTGGEDFNDVYSLVEVNFAEGSKLKTLGEWAFENQKALKSVELPEGVAAIEKGTFRGCSAMQSLTIPASIERIGSFDIDEAHGEGEDEVYPIAYGCNSLTSITFAENSRLKEIGHGAFMGLSSLKSINLPASVETVGIVAFNPDPTNPDSVLETINVDEANENFKSADGVLYTKDGKTLVDYPAAKSGDFVIPNGVTAIQRGAFQLAQITSLTFPEGFTALTEEDTVNSCKSLTSIALPETLTTIESKVFTKLDKLTSIRIPKSVTSIAADAFDECALKNIDGVAGSYAETFAKENGYSFNGEPNAEDNTFTDDSEDKAADVQVTAKPNVIPKEAHFSVRLDDKNTTAERIAYNCYFTYNGAEYEPTDTVTVKIPVPVAMRDIADTLKVYHLQDGKYVNMKATVVDGYLVFDTDHFSTYIVTAEELDKETGSNNNVPPGDTDPASKPVDKDPSGSGDGSASGSDQQPTGIALAIAPVVLAAGAVIAVSANKKKK